MLYCRGKQKKQIMSINNVSVIIPTRNCIYLEKVLSSLDQFFNDVIVVGESNLDFKRYNNVKFFHNSNANASKNRNFGSEKAKNEYLFFLTRTAIKKSVRLNC